MPQLQRTLLTLLQSGAPAPPPPQLPVYVDYGPPPVYGRIVASFSWSARLSVQAHAPVRSAGIAARLRLGWSASLAGQRIVPVFPAYIRCRLPAMSAAVAGAVDLSAPLARLRAEDERLALLLLYAARRRRRAA